MASFSGRTLATIRSSFSSRPTSINLRTSSVRSPFPWCSSVTRTATSPSGSLRTLMSRATARISCSPGLWILELGNERHFSVVVYEILLRHPGMRHARAQAYPMKIAEVNGNVGKALMERSHQRFVLRTDWTDQYGRSDFGFPPFEVLGGVGRDGHPGNCSGSVDAACITVRASKAVIPQADAGNGLMSISFIQGCSGRACRTAQELVLARHVRRGTTSHALQSRETCVCSIKRRSRVAFSGRNVSARSR